MMMPHPASHHRHQLGTDGEAEAANVLVAPQGSGAARETNRCMGRSGTPGKQSEVLTMGSLHCTHEIDSKKNR